MQMQSMIKRREDIRREETVREENAEDQGLREVVVRCDGLVTGGSWKGRFVYWRRSPQQYIMKSRRGSKGVRFVCYEAVSQSERLSFNRLLLPVDNLLK